MNSKLTYQRGCVCDSLNIDGVETIDMPLSEVRKLAIHLLSDCRDISIIQDVLMSIAEQRGEYESLGKCDCCGDCIERYTLEF